MNSSDPTLVLDLNVGTSIKYALKLHFSASNNDAEYEALLSGLRVAIEMDAQSILVYSDSQLVVNQVNGEFEAREERMQEYLGMVKALIPRFQYFQISHIPRGENVAADSLARLASSLETSSAEPTLIGHQLERSKLNAETGNINCVNSGPNWMTPIHTFLQEGTEPNDHHEAKKLRMRASRYTLIQNTLYKKGYCLPLLRCLSPEDADYALREIHEGICGNHSGGRSLAHKALRQGFFWPTMMKDAVEFVKRCDKCQHFATVP